MDDAGHTATIPNFLTLTQSRMTWGVEIGSHRLSFTRTKEARTVGCLGDTLKRQSQRTERKLIRPFAIGSFASVSAFGLAVISASASEPSEVRAMNRYILSVPVPSREARRTDRLQADPLRETRPGSPRTVSSPPPAGVSPSTQFGSDDESHVALALQAGELQEWIGADGQRRFLNPGPLLAEAGRFCRDLALLVRRLDGGSHTRSERRCSDGRNRGGAVVAQPPQPDAGAFLHAGQEGPVAVDVQQESASSAVHALSKDSGGANAGARTASVAQAVAGMPRQR